VTAPQRKVVVLGGGTMGSGVAMVFAGGGWDVQLVDPSATLHAALPARLAEGMARAGLNPEAAGRVRVVGALTDVQWGGVELVSESATEDLVLKRRIFAELEALAPAATLLTSNSSSYPIGEIGEGLKTRHRMLGLHFLMPAQFVPIVEVVCAQETAPALADGLMETMRGLGKQPVRVNKDLVGYLVNRIQAALMREALDLVDKGVATAEDVDAAVRYGFGFRYAVCGPILQKEHSGWEISTNLYRRVFPTLSNAQGPAGVLEKMLADRRYGMKTGGGFMDWDAAAIARERERYENGLRALLDLMREHQ
jgi:3-hydroxybutyryl-CoA dehydrogenase